MDWSVILDGFVLLMAWVSFGFLLYGGWLAFDYQVHEANSRLRDLTESPSTSPEASEPTRCSPEFIELCERKARHERSAAVGAALAAAADGLIGLVHGPSADPGSRFGRSALAIASVALVAFLGMIFALNSLL